MAKNLRTYSVSAPGFLGLNSQDAPIDMDNKFALEANNCVIDKYGRVGSRKGWTTTHDAAAALGTATVDSIGELVQVDGTRTIVCAGNNKLFKKVGATLTELTYGGGGVAPTIATSNWQTCCMNDAVIFWQEGYDPLVYDVAVSTTTYKRVSEHASYLGTVPKADCAVAAYGRVWAASSDTDKQTIYWSDLLTYAVWSTGTSGSLDLRGVWPQGGDEIAALAAHNNSLIIFGKRQILIYTGAETPATMQLSDAVANCGCIGRDSVQNTPSDILFLSDGGVRSIARTIQEKSAPLTVISRTVNDDVIAYTNSAGTSKDIKAVYSPVDQFYLLTFKSSLIVYCFDMRTLMPDGAAKATIWFSIKPQCFHYSSGDRTLYMGQVSNLAKYDGYSDNGVQYRMTYFTSWYDFGDPVMTTILKKINFTLIGVLNTSIVYKWGFDYRGSTFAQAPAVDPNLVSSEYSIAEYALAEYNANLLAQSISVNAGGIGKVLQIGIELNVAGHAISIQRIDIYTKDGAYK